MKIDQTQSMGSVESVEDTAENANQNPEILQARVRAEEKAEEELQKLFLARLDVHSRIADIKRNRASLRARKMDVERKIALLCEFDSKLMQREEELNRLITES